VSEAESLNQRLEFIGLDAAAIRSLQSTKPVIDAAIGPTMEAFYERIGRFPETAAFFSDARQMDRAKAAQTYHWSRIVSGGFDASYVQSAERAGETHARIGLAPRWYIGGYALVLERLVTAVIEQHERSRPAWARRDPKPLAAAVGAVIKAGMLDVELVVSVYLAAIKVEQDRLQAANDAQRAEQQQVVARLAEALSKLAAGDMTFRLDEDFPGEYRQLQDDFNAANAQLQQAMKVIAENALSIHSGAGEISNAADDLSRRTEQQAATLEETAAALDEITATVKRTADGATQAREVVSRTKADAEKSGAVVGEAVEAMSCIEKSANEISQIIGVIDEIAFQTNLLALNAGVEAARAGDAGKGFAVVASEVRALAQRSAEAAKEIKGLISTSSQQVRAGVDLVGQTGQALKRIVDQVVEINDVVMEMAASAQQQSTGLNQVNTAVNQMDQVTQQNAAMVEQSTAASHNLAREAETLSSLLSRFRIEAGAGPVIKAAPRPSAPRTVPQMRHAGGRGASAVRAPAPVQDEQGWEEF
jgi:methyl-accepting chemotaxis protein